MDLQQRVIECLKKCAEEEAFLDQTKVTATATLNDIEADSLDAIHLLIAIEDEFAIDEISDSDAAKITSVPEMIAYLQSKGF